MAKHFFKREEEDRQEKEEGKLRERKTKTGCSMGKMVLPPVDDRPKSGGGLCGVGKCPNKQETDGSNAR